MHNDENIFGNIKIPGSRLKRLQYWDQLVLTTIKLLKVIVMIHRKSVEIFGHKFCDGHQ